MVSSRFSSFAASLREMNFMRNTTALMVQKFTLAMTAACVLAAFTWGLSGSPAHADGDGDALPFDETAALETSEAAIGTTLGRYAFTDVGNKVRRLDSFLGKPIIISLIYTGCADVCPTVSESLANAIETAQDTFGTQAFNVVTIGFDAQNDTPARMRSFAASHGLRLDNWYFLSGDQGSIDRMADDLGFIFFTSSKGFDHMTRTTVIDGEGVVYRHIYGADVEPPHLMEPLKDLIYGRVGNMTSLEGIINKVRLFCTIYDPRQGRYRFDYSIFILISAATIGLGGFATIIIRSLLSNRRKTRSA